MNGRTSMVTCTSTGRCDERTRSRNRHSKESFLYSKKAFDSRYHSDLPRGRRLTLIEIRPHYTIIGSWTQRHFNITQDSQSHLTEQTKMSISTAIIQFDQGIVIIQPVSVSLRSMSQWGPLKYLFLSNLQFLSSSFSVFGSQNNLKKSTYLDKKTILSSIVSPWLETEK